MTTDPTARFSLAGKSIIITGASGSMGREAAKGLGAAGANITLAGGNRAALEELAALPELAGAAIAPHRPDTPEDAKAIVDAAIAAFGRLDGMLVASGMNKVALITAYDFLGNSILGSRVAEKAINFRQSLGKRSAEIWNGGAVTSEFGGTLLMKGIKIQRMCLFESTNAPKEI